MKNTELALFITAIALFLAEGKTEDEITLLAAFFVQLGDTLTTLALTPPDNKKPSESKYSYEYI